MLAPHSDSLCVPLLQRLQAMAHQAPDLKVIHFLAEGDTNNAQTRTYSQLQQNACCIAHSVNQYAVAGDRVVLLLPAGPDYFAAVWGCLMVGVVVVPVAIPQQPAQMAFTQKIIADSGAAIIFTQSDVKQALADVFTGLDDELSWLLLEDARAVDVRVDWPLPADHAPALLQYTSGSTGSPKGVIVTHGNLAASIDLMLQVADIDNLSTVVSWLPLFHNMGFICFGLLPLCVGCRVVLMPTESFMLNPARWFMAISHYRATHSGAPNVGYESCLNFLPDALLERLDLSAWRVAAIGSEPLKANLIDQFSERFSACGFRAETFLTTYGFSEATVFSSGADHNAMVPRLQVDKAAFENGQIKPAQDQAVKTLVSVGCARPNVAIVDPQTHRLCGDRELGEIWVCGPTVAAGYWNKPQVTAETFGVFAENGSGPYVRSGDIGMLADGNLYVVGRRKELIIVGSKKLHPLDIEQVVNGNSSMFVPYATSASAWQTEQGEALAIFQELKPDTDAAEYLDLITDMCDIVYERFAVNVDRVVLLRMGSLPRTHNGKLLRIQCCERVDNGSLGDNVVLDWRAADSGQFAQITTQLSMQDKSSSISLTPTQKKLVLLWQELMNRSFVSIDADFVSLGGQSIIATRIVAQLRQAFRLDLSIRTLFRFSTIRKLARHIEELQSTAPKLGESDIEADINVDKGGWLPLTSAQQRLWMLNQIDSETAAYHMCVSFLIKGNLNQSALQQSIQVLVQRYDILRTVYRRAENGSAEQRPVQLSHFPLEYHDLVAVAFSDKSVADAHIESLLQHSRVASFDLSRDVMLRACLIRTADDCYTLALTVHHIAADGWSVEILMRELMASYRSFMVGTEPDLPKIKWQYAQWALRHEQAAFYRQQQQLDYWLQQLKGLPACHDLPVDRPRLNENDFRGQSLYTEISAQQLAQLTTAGRNQGVTLYMQLQLALAVLMARLTGDVDGPENIRKDVVIGAAYANRDYSDCDSIIGFFVNSLVIRHAFEPDTSLSNLLQQCRDTVLDAYEHADLPFDVLVEKMNPPRTGNYNPLFQVMLNLQSKDSWNLQLPGLDIEPFQVGTEEAKFDLSLDCTQSEDGLSLQWEFNDQLFDVATIARWSGYFERILMALCATPEISWERISLLDDDERQQLLYHFNDTEFPLHDVCIHTLYERQADRQPNATALLYGDTSWSYQQLNQRANQLAHQLIALGVQPDDRIVILIERSPFSVLAMLAVLKSGAAYVPIDPAYPQDRIEFILLDAKPKAVITDHNVKRTISADISQLLEALALPDVHIDSMQTANLQSDQVHNPDVVGVSPQHLAYLMYTSGSTGRPKGVMLEHRQVANLVCNNHLVPVNAHHCIAHCANPAFDAATWEVWGALTQGARVTVISPEQVLNPPEFVRELQQQRVNCMMLTVSLFNQYRHILAPVLSQLDYCLIGGEAVDPLATLDTLRNSAPRHFINDYGPTETTVFITCHEVQLADAELSSIPIGKPVANTQIYILDRFGEPVPTGVVGEMYAAGAQVARGYWNRPEVNAERFLQNPFKPRVASYPDRLYRTGDLARWRADGELEFLGRNDFQVKIRGYRVELGEIEQALVSYDSVQDAVVLARQDAPADTRLVAYVVQATHCSLDGNEWFAELQTQLGQQLPDYMLPSAWMKITSLPLTAHGKLDRSALPKPDNTLRAQRQIEQPQGSQETRLAQAWQDLLNVPQVGRQDNFFGLGGHSLLAVRLSEALRQQGLKLDVRSIFHANTLAQMAQKIQPLEHEAAAPLRSVVLNENATCITPDMLPGLTITQAQIDSVVCDVAGGVHNIQSIYRLSPLQEGILFHHLMAQEDDPYLLRSIMAFDSKAALDEFLVALEIIVERHDILRSSIHWNGLDQPVQVVHRCAPLALQYFDADSNVKSAADLMMLLDQARGQFSMNNAPLVSVAIARDASRWLLGVQAHHIIADNQTLELIFAEIQMIRTGQQDLLPSAIPFSHYVTQQRDASSLLHETYFQQLLSDYEEPAFLFGEQSDTVARNRNCSTALSISNERLASLRLQARQQHVPLSTLVHLAWGLVLSGCSGRDDVVFGTVMSGRVLGQPCAEKAMGLFINTLPVRLQADERSVSDSVRGLYQQLTQLANHEHAPLALAKRCSSVAAEAPLFNVLLNYRHKQGAAEAGVVASLQADGIELLSMEQNTHYPIALSVNESDDELLLSLQTPDSMDGNRLLQYCQTALENLANILADDPDAALISVSILPEIEREKIVQEFALPAVLDEKFDRVHHCFERLVERQPDAIALVYENTQTRYCELNKRANMIAHALLNLGVQPDDRVAVCMHRGTDLVAAIIGVLKSGAGYVPVDPGLPNARIKFVLQDSQPSAFLTNSTLFDAMAQDHFALQIPTLCVDQLADEVLTNPQITALRGHHLAYMIYTSGSTGQPKGVMVEHQQLSHLFTATAGLFEFNAQDVWTLFHSISFDFAVWEIWGALVYGARIVIVPEDITRASDEFYHLLCTEKVTVLNQTPGAFNALLNARNGQANDGQLNALRYVVLSGEALDAQAIRRWHESHFNSNTRLINMYGITEITVLGSFCDVSDAGQSTSAVSIGKPLANTPFYILDKHYRPVPVGVSGEIYVGGGQVARGYWQQPELNDQRFIDNPFWQDQPDLAKRLYRSGDLGCWREDGTLEYHGRNDFQVKIRGYRVELGEIESHLHACANVRDVVVVARDDAIKRQLVAYIVPASDTGLSLGPLQNDLASRLPHYMLPSAYVILPELPLTTNGKVDARALPAPDHSTEKDAYEAPQGDLEQQLAHIWSVLLGIDLPSRNEPFLTLGGDSLLVVQMNNAIKRDLGVSLPLRSVFELATIAKLCELIGFLRKSAAGDVNGQSEQEYEEGALN